MSDEQKEFSELIELLEKLTSQQGNTGGMSDSDELDNLISMSFDDMTEDLIKDSKTKTLKVKRLHQDAILPNYNYPSDSGFDLYSVVDLEIEPFSRIGVPTGLSFEFEEGYEIQVRTKSGLALNHGLMVLNSPGTVDQGYSGEIIVIVFNTTNEKKQIKKGMKVGQGVLCPVVNGNFVKIQEIEELSEKDRGDKGFGSTGI